MRSGTNHTGRMIGLRFSSVMWPIAREHFEYFIFYPMVANLQSIVCLTRSGSTLRCIQSIDSLPSAGQLD